MKKLQNQYVFIEENLFEVIPHVSMMLISQNIT